MVRYFLITQVLQILKISSSTVEMKENKKFSNNGEIIGNNVTLTTTNDIDLVGKLHGAQSLTISGKI